MTGRVADWDAIPHARRNRWQRIAASTHGIVTPGNLVSFISIIIAIGGFVLLYQDKLLAGFIGVTLGRIFDVLDGYAAHYTGTKSSVGELVDAGMDKIVMLVAFLVFAATGLVPFWPLVLLGIQQLVAAMLGGYARLKHLHLHPSRMGKYAAVVQWAALLMYVLFAIIGDVPGMLVSVLHGVFIVSIIAGYAATYGYVVFVYRASRS